MRIQFMSDLHLEFGDMETPPVKGDVLVLAGDIHTGTQGVEFINRCADVFPYVLVLMGNHEFYHNNMATLADEINHELNNPAFEMRTNVFLLDNYAIQIDDVNFIGTTLWSDIRPQAFYSMNDSRIIHNGEHKLSSLQVQALFQRNVEFIKDHLMGDIKNVVLTHHAPSSMSINETRYGKNTIMNTGYATNILDQFEGKVDLWIHGHTHHCVDYEEYGIHVVSNQRGYVGYEEVEEFDMIATVEV